MKIFTKSYWLTAFFMCSMAASAQYNVAINVTEGGPFGVPGAEVIMNGDTMITDFFGGVLYQNLPNGTYPYTVTKACYQPYADTAVVNGAAVVEFAVITPETYNAAVNTLGNGPVGFQGAEVILNGDTLITDFFGGVLFQGLPNGTYPYTITLACYETVFDTLTINCASALEFNQLTPETYNAAINTLGNGPVGFQGAEVILNGDTLITDFFGGVLFQGLPNGTYPYTITLACYETVFDTLTINCASALEFNQLTPETYNVAVNTIGNGPVGYQGAEVILNGDTLITDFMGGVLFQNLSNGTYPYTITLACFEPFMDTVVVNCGNEITFDMLVPLVIGDSISNSICKGDSIVFGTQTVSQAGIYTEVFTSSAGCDSTVVLTLGVDSVDTQVSVSGVTITANLSGATYQWIDCSTNQPISGETGQSFTATANGDYAVIIDDMGCTDVSTCVTISTIGLEEKSLLAAKLYPNPATNNITLTLGQEVVNAHITMVDFTGRTIQSAEKHHTTEFTFEVANLAAGVYFINVSTEQGERTLRFIKQ